MRRLAHLAQTVGHRWLREIVAARVGPTPKYTKLAIFDFDGTLFRSPGPPEGEDSEGWWSDTKSLSPPHVDDKPKEDMWHPDSVDRMRELIKDPDTYVVVMTGRHNDLQDRIQAMLDSAGLKPDELITNPKHGDVTQYKRDEMLYLLRQFPRVGEVEFWEDRKSDLKGYQRVIKELGKNFTPQLVKNYEDKPPPYIGVFLTPDAKRQLLEAVPPKHSEVQADHITLSFKPSAEQMKAIRDRFRMGQRVPIKVTGVAADDKAQAVTIELPGDIASLGKDNPHITISVAEGVSPAYSNMLLSEGVQSIEPRVYSGYLDVGPRPGSPASKQPSKGSGKAERRRIWQEFIQQEVRNPEYGKPGHHKERVLRKTLYDAGGTGRKHVMREWGPYLHSRLER